ncbi:MAG: YfhO family protein, partial [Candidatus Omnitrophica bacterium]|nr:YfhO family protein [Candidatus Omnitrophota bacterium]
LASLGKKWWGRKIYLFFLSFALLVLLKNIGFPVISLIGKLPVFDQVWTPRWAGPAWNLSLALCVALGFESLLLTDNKEPGKSSKASWALMIGGLLILAAGTLINQELSAILSNAFGYPREYFLSTAMILRPFLIAISAVMLFISVRRLNLSALFFILSLAVMFCVVHFRAQLPRIEGPFGFNLGIRDGLVLFSMWQGMMESVLLGLAVILVISVLLRERPVDKNRFALIILGIIIIEMSFHVTLGYDERARLVRLLWHFIALAGLILYSLFLKDRLNKIETKMFLCLFFIGMIVIGRAGSQSLPERGKDIFQKTYIDLVPEGASRIMGIKGFLPPNAAAALGVQDIRSVTSLSIKRFQLFQDYCLSASPQSKYKSLWFTGTMDPATGKNISEHLRQRHAFYSLSGVGNYLSADYENIPYTKLVNDAKIKNYQNLAVMPRVFMVHNWFTSKNTEESLEWMLSARPSFNSQAVVEGKEIPAIPDIQGKPSAKAEIKKYQLHSVTIEAQTNYPALLILTDAYHPDWMVSVDGKKEKIFPADLCFRGVFLNPGKHEVKFFYFPRAFYICAAVSLSVFLILLILGLRSLILKKLKKQIML